MARLFDDSDLQLLSNGAAVLTAEPITMACWFYSDDATSEFALMNLGASANNRATHLLELRGDVGGDPVRALSLRDPSGSLGVDTTTGYSANTWHHACGVWAAVDDRRVFIDGGSKGTTTSSLTVTTLDRTTIGVLRRSLDVIHLSGRIAEAAFWNVALTDAEVAVVAKFSPLFVKPENLVFYMRGFRETSSGDDMDIIGGLVMTSEGTAGDVGNTPHPEIFSFAPPLIGFAAAAAVAAGLPKGTLSMLGVGV